MRHPLLLTLAAAALAACGSEPKTPPNATEPPHVDKPADAKKAPADAKKDDKAIVDTKKDDAKAGGDGKTAANGFSLKGVNQAKVELKTGKVTIVDFWATWCEPCKKSFPKLQALYVKYQSSGLEIAALSEDDEEGGISAFASTYGAKFPIAWDKGKIVAAKWKPQSMPTTYVCDKNGKIRFTHTGYHDGEDAEIEKEVKQLLNEK